jgi:hypothetical protein
LIVVAHNKVVFFFVLLISLIISELNAQTQPNDTLKKVSADTLKVNEDSESLEEKVDYSGEDSVVALPQEGRAIMYGKAKVNYGSVDMQSEVIEINYSKNLIIAKGKRDSLGKPYGNPTFKDGSETIEADTIIYNLKSKKGKIFNALTRQGELLVVGDEIKKDSLNNVYFKDMRCIPCQEADARTVFRAKKAKAIPDDKIVTGPMYLEIAGVPTLLGLPFGYFPNTKKQANGILLPTFGNSAERGYNLSQGGFYWGISEKTDMEIRGDIFANGTWALSSLNRYNVLYKSTGNTFVKYSNFIVGDKDIPSSYSKKITYQINWQHTQDNKSDPSIRFTANVNYVGNQQYNRFNAINSGQYLQNTFMSNIVFSKTFKMSSLSLNAMHNQNSISKQMEITLPQLTYNVNRFFPFKKENAIKQNVFDKLGMSYLLEAKNTLSGRDSTIFKGSPLDSLNYGLRQSIPVSTNFNILKYITVTPGLNLSSVMYTKSIQKSFYSETVSKTYVRGDGTSITRDTLVHGVRTQTLNELAAGYDANFSTAFNTKLYFDYQFLTGKVKQIRHVLIPTITYNYRPDFGEEQYGFWKKYQTDTLGNTLRYSVFEKGIYGGPGMGKQNAITVNLNNNIEAKIKQVTDTGITYKKVVLIQGLGINGSYNLAADSFKMSPIGVTLRTVLFKYFDINANSNFNPYYYDKISGYTYSRYTFNEDGRLARLTNASFAISTSIGSNMIEALKKIRQSPDMTNGAERGAKEDLDPSERLPWNLRINYNLNLSNNNDWKLQPSHTMNFSGDLMPTKFWKIGVTSGFDFINQRLSYTSFSVYRDLKCWEAHIDWIPFGLRKSYMLTLNLKTSMLNEFKIPKRSIPRLDGY